MTLLLQIFCFLLLPVSASATPQSPEGQWYTKGRNGVVEIKKGQKEMAGTIVWVNPKPDRSLIPFAKLPMFSGMEGKDALGKTVLQDIKARKDGSWEGKMVMPEKNTALKTILRIKGNQLLLEVETPLWVSVDVVWERKL